MRLAITSSMLKEASRAMSVGSVVLPVLANSSIALFMRPWIMIDDQFLLHCVSWFSPLATKNQLLAWLSPCSRRPREAKTSPVVGGLQGAHVVHQVHAGAGQLHVPARQVHDGAAAVAHQGAQAVAVHRIEPLGSSAAFCQPRLTLWQATRAVATPTACFTLVSNDRKRAGYLSGRLAGRTRRRAADPAAGVTARPDTTPAGNRPRRLRLGLRHGNRSKLQPMTWTSSISR